jgi:hypothetical protein
MTEAASADGTLPRDPHAPLREFVALIDRMTQHLRQQHPKVPDDLTVRIATSLLDAAIALLGLHAPRVRRDGSFYCAHCLDQAGGHVWPCQTIGAFGIALLRHWQPPKTQPPAPARSVPAPVGQTAGDGRAPREHSWFEADERP